MSMNRVTTFWDAVRALSFKEMMQVADEVAEGLPHGEPVTGLRIANALTGAADGKETRPTRGKADA